MKAFLQRFYTEVDEWLGDPTDEGGISLESKRRHLFRVSRQVFDALMGMTMQESTFGYAEALVTLKDGVSIYPLPAGFRQFLNLDLLRDDGGVIGSFSSKTHFSRSWGVEILDSLRFRIHPAPRLSADQDWTLRYLRGPTQVHYAQASSVSGKTLISKGPENEDAGELFSRDGHYNGLSLIIYEADGGVPFSSDILEYTAKTRAFHLRETIPATGKVWYEISPGLPEPLDSIYALDVALSFLPARENPQKAATLFQTRDSVWEACKEFVLSNVSDRPPERIHPPDRYSNMPSGETPWWR